MRDDEIHAEETFKGGWVPGMQSTDQSVYNVHTYLQNTPSEFFVLYSLPSSPKAKSNFLKLSHLIL